MGFLLPPAEYRYVCTNLERLGYPNLRAYIDSPWWRKRRAAYYVRHPYKCRACGATEKLNLHHVSYKRMGRERDSDLKPLCEVPCHPNEHLRWAKQAANAKKPPRWRRLLRFLLVD